MFAVRIESLKKAQGDMKSICSYLIGAQSELNGVRRRLNENTSMEEPLKALAALEGRMEEQALIMGQMALGLERIAGAYQAAEGRATDYLEGFRNERRDVLLAQNDFTGVRETLGDIKFL